VVIIDIVEWGRETQAAVVYRRLFVASGLFYKTTIWFVYLGSGFGWDLDG